MNKIGILYGYWCTEWDVDYSPYLEKVKQLGFDTLAPDREVPQPYLYPVASGRCAALRVGRGACQPGPAR